MRCRKLREMYRLLTVVIHKQGRHEMKLIVLIGIGLALAACTAAHPDSLIGKVYDTVQPGERLKAEQEADDAMCRDFGFERGTQGYSDCRLKLEALKASKRRQ
jgi:hypothetical protein